MARTDKLTDKRKQSLYFPAEMLSEIQHEAARLDRSLSWVVQFCWRSGRKHVAALPSHHVTPEADAVVGDSGDPKDPH